MPSSHAAVLAENDQREVRLVTEVAHPTDHRMAVHATLGGGLFDDHTTDLGQCHGCGAWIARTTYATSRDVSDRYLSPEEMDKLQLLDDRYRRADQ